MEMPTSRRRPGRSRSHSLPCRHRQRQMLVCTWILLGFGNPVTTAKATELGFGIASPLPTSTMVTRWAGVSWSGHRLGPSPFHESHSLRFRAWRQPRGSADSLVVPVRARGRQSRPRMSMAEETEKEAPSTAILSAVTVAALGTLYYGLHHPSQAVSPDTVLETVREGKGAVTTAIQTFLTTNIEKVQDLGALGPLYFGAVYVLAEVLAIPALPFTAAAGYLFGVAGGTLVVLVSASIAAGISFTLGRTFLRKQVEGLFDENPRFQAIDKAIGKEGFKIILLLRLSPIFPFALSNYLYGVTAVGFAEYMAGTLIGFFPGTLAYVYGGSVGKVLTDSGDKANLPWYGYAAAAVVIALILKTVGDVATNAIEEMDPSLRDKS